MSHVLKFPRRRTVLSYSELRPIVFGILRLPSTAGVVFTVHVEALSIEMVFFIFQELLDKICDAYYLPAWCAPSEYITLANDLALEVSFSNWPGRCVINNETSISISHPNTEPRKFSLCFKLPLS